MSSTARYQSALDEMYRGYMAKRHLVSGLLDREFKDPKILVDVARELDLLPPADRTIKITGSKGKGTTRLIASYLQRVRPGEGVALFVSPEEYEHTDRMKMNGSPIEPETFVEIFEALRPHLVKAEAKLDKARYLSPFGIFLLIALTWFKRQRADWYVLEIGRGGAHDEVGVMGADHAVVTSVFEEHADHLGPSVCEIAAEKAAVASHTLRTFVSAQAENILRACDLWESFSFETQRHLAPRQNIPAWLVIDDALARQSVAAMAQVEDRELLALNISNVSAAWGTARYRDVEITYDALINLESLDRGWFARSFRGERLLVLHSLPDDKDRERLNAFLDSVRNATCREIVLLGKRGYLSYEKALMRAEHVAAEIHYDDSAHFLVVLDEQIARYAPTKVYCFGTQTYLRLVKRALAAS